MRRLSAAALLAAALLAVSCLRAEAPMPEAQHGKVRTAGAELAWRAYGRGEPLLLITGYAMTMEGWDPALTADLASDRRVIVFDNRGMGRSTADAAPLSLALLAQDAAGLLQGLGIGQADVLGWSMGGGAALELALNRPELVRRLILYAPVRDGAAIRETLARMDALSPQEFLARLFPKPYLERRPDALARLPKPDVPPDPAMVARQRQALLDWPGPDDRLARLTAPTLLVVGQDDELTPPDQALDLASRIKGSWLVRFRNAGHWLMYQCPRDLARTVRTFLTVRLDAAGG